MFLHRSCVFLSQRASFMSLIICLHGCLLQQPGSPRREGTSSDSSLTPEPSPVPGTKGPLYRCLLNKRATEQKLTNRAPGSPAVSTLDFLAQAVAETRETWPRLLPSDSFSSSSVPPASSSQGVPRDIGGVGQTPGNPAQGPSSSLLGWTGCAVGLCVL